MTALISCSAIAYNIFLPSMPDIAQYFEVSVFSVQSTLISFLVAYAIAHFFYGGIADRYGRKPVLLWGLGIYITASLACAASNSMTMLILFRILQGVGAAGSMVMVRSMVRDLYNRQESARALAIISSVMAFAPASAPALGGYLQIHYGWQASFIFLGILGIALFIYCALFMDESHKVQGDKFFSNLKLMAVGYRSLVSQRVFVAYNLNIGFVSGAVFAWFAGVPIILINSYGVSPEQFGYLMLTGTSGAFCGYASTILLTARLGVNRMIVIGTSVGLCGASIYLALPLLGIFTPLSAIAPMFIFAIGLAMTFPNAMAASVSVLPHYAGTGAALNGLSQYGIAALVTLAVGLLPSTNHLPLAWVIFILQLLATIATYVGWSSRPVE